MVGAVLLSCHGLDISGMLPGGLRTCKATTSCAWM